MLRVFIGWDSRFEEPAKVLAHSMRKHSTIGLDVRYLDLEHLKRCYDFNPEPDPKASTEFTRSRFLVPYLCGYDGLAAFVDNDVVALGDMAELMHTVETISAERWQATAEVPALYVVQHDYRPADGVKMYGAVQEAYPRKLWSSLMVMDCSQLRCWTKELVETAPGSRLHRFQDIPDEKIAALPFGWNEVKDVTPDTKLYHYTEGGPWYDQYKNCPFSGLWHAARDEYRATLERTS
jgi:hypothetical protein